MQINNTSWTRRHVLILGVCCLLAQIMLAPYFMIYKGAINFALIFVLCISMSIGGRASIILAFCAGLLFDLLSLEPIGLMSLILVICAYVLSYKEHNYLAHDLKHAVVLGVFWCIVACAIQCTTLVYLNRASFVLTFLQTFLPSVVLTSLGFILCACILSRVNPARQHRVRRSKRLHF